MRRAHHISTGRVFSRGSGGGQEGAPHLDGQGVSEAAEHVHVDPGPGNVPHTAPAYHDASPLRSTSTVSTARYSTVSTARYIG
eukprot:176160-Pyramimonas_sp.AAC.1